MNVALRWQSSPGIEDHAEQFGHLAAFCLKLEVKTFPKPGLVSHVDHGSHSDMDAENCCAAVPIPCAHSFATWRSPGQRPPE
jgi:triphosphoribosyl-dephospho-CoA synthase